MKKTKLLVLSALGLFFVTSCDANQKDISSIVEKVANADDAIEYVKSLYLSSPASVTGDFERIAEFSLEGFTYNVEWTLTLDAEADQTAVVKGEIVDKKQKFTVKFNEDTSKESKFSLTAAIKDAQGNDHTVKFDYKVPEFKFNSLTEFMQLADDGSKDTVTVKGKVVAYYKDGPYITNDAGEGFYCYSLSGGLSSMKEGSDLWPIGTEVIVTGTATKYSGQYEFASGCVVTKKNDAATDFAVSFTDLSNELKDATSNGDKELVKYINRPVELEGVTVDACPDASADEKSQYFYFKLGNNKYYFRPYASWYDSKTLTQFTADQVTALVNAEDWVKGYTATLRGILGIYNNAYYVSPISSEGSYTITSRVVSDEVKAELALEEAATLFGEYYDGTSLTLPANPTGETYSDAVYSYELVGEAPEGWAIAGGKLTYNVPAEGKLEAQVKVTATVGEKAKDATYKISAFIPQPITVQEFIEEEPTKVVFVQGIVTAVNNNDPTKADSFVLSNNGYSMFSYNKFPVTLGDEVIIKAKYAFDNSKVFPQFGTTGIYKVVSHDNDVVAASGTPLETTCAEIKAAMDKCTSANDLADLYANKYVKVKGFVVKSGTYYNMAPEAGGTVNLNTYYNKNMDLSPYVGKEVEAVGFVRGVSYNAAGSKITVQFQSFDFANQADKDLRYSVTLTEAANCTIALKDATQATTNLPFATKLTYTIALADGYELKELKVNGSDIIATIKDGEFTITVSDNMTIVPTVGTTFNGSVVKGTSLSVLDSTQSGSYAKYAGNQTIGVNTIAINDVMPNTYGGKLEAIQMKAGSGSMEFTGFVSSIVVELYSTNDFDNEYSLINLLCDDTSVTLDKVAIQATKTATEGSITNKEVVSTVYKYTITLTCDGTASHKYAIKNNATGAKGARYLGTITITNADPE